MWGLRQDWQSHQSLDAGDQCHLQSAVYPKALSPKHYALNQGFMGSGVRVIALVMGLNG